MVAPMVIGALVGAGLGAARQKEEMRKAEANRKLQATIASNPWSKMTADTSNLQDPSLMGNVQQGAVSGAQFGMQDAFKGGGEAPAGAGPATPGVADAGPTAVAMGGGQNPNQGQAPLMAYQNTGQAPNQSMAMLNGGQSSWLQMDPNDPYKKQTMLAGNP